MRLGAPRASIPRASPETTTTPARASSRPSVSATSPVGRARAGADHRDAGRSSSSSGRGAAQKSPRGGSWIARRLGGNRHRAGHEAQRPFGEPRRARRVVEPAAKRLEPRIRAAATEVGAVSAAYMARASSLTDAAPSEDGRRAPQRDARLDASAEPVPRSCRPRERRAHGRGQTAAGARRPA